MCGASVEGGGGGGGLNNVNGPLTNVGCGGGLVGFSTLIDECWAWGGLVGWVGRGGGLNDVHCLCSSPCAFGCRRWQSVIHVVLALTSLTQEDVAVVCVLVLLLRLGRFPQAYGFAELRPLFRVSAYTVDPYVDGLCVDVRDHVQRFVVETPIQVERSCVNRDLVAAARSQLRVRQRKS